MRKTLFFMFSFFWCVAGANQGAHWTDYLSNNWRSMLKVVFPTTVCDKQYAYLMEWTLQQWSSRTNFDSVLMCREYMMLSKWQQDLTLLISYFEREIFSSDDLYELQRPIQEYTHCTLNLGDDSHVLGLFLRAKIRGDLQRAIFLESEFPATGCDQGYERMMVASLKKIEIRLDTAMARLAKEYMILVKHQENIGRLIAYLERSVFGATDLNELRKPLTQYFRCYNTLGTGVV